MFRILLLLFLIVPITEIYLLIQVGGILGVWPTVFLVVFTAVLGAWLLRIQGFSTLKRVQASLSRGEIPAIEMLGGILLLLSGALLLTPGFFTDTIGFLMLIPVLRRVVVMWFLSKGNIVSQFGFQSQQTAHSDESSAQIPPDFKSESDRNPKSAKDFPQHPHQPRTFEGEYREDD